MNAKISILILLLVAGGVGAATFYNQTEELKRDLAAKVESNRRLEIEVKSVRDQVAQWDSLKDSLKITEASFFPSVHWSSAFVSSALRAAGVPA